MSSSESGVPVDRGTQTASFAPHGPLHYPSPSGSMPLLGESHAGTHMHTHLFSHLPLHSQQPSRSPYSMVPVGGIQLVPAGLAAYSTFVPIQAGPMHALSIPALSVIHRNTSPIPGQVGTGPGGSGSGPTAIAVGTSSPQRPDGSPGVSQQAPLVVQEGMGNMLPCFPLGQVAGIQTFGAQQSASATAAALQSIGLEALGMMGLATSSGLVPTQQNLALNASLGVQVLAAASPAYQSAGSGGPQTHHHHHHIPGLQILNIALPALIPSLSPLSALSPLPPLAATAAASSPDRLASLEVTAAAAATAAGPGPGLGSGPGMGPGPGPGPSRSPSLCSLAAADSAPVLTFSASPATQMVAATTAASGVRSTSPMAPVVVTTHAPPKVTPPPPCRSSSSPGSRMEHSQLAVAYATGVPSSSTSERKAKSPPHHTHSLPGYLDGPLQTAPTDTATTKNTASATATGGASEARPTHKHTSPRAPAPAADDGSDASSDDEDRLVIAT